MSEEKPVTEQTEKKAKQPLPTDATDLVVSQTVKLGNITVEVSPQGLERFLADNDASALAGNALTRSLYYSEMCRRYEVDPFTKPFDWIEASGKGGNKLTLYPNKEFAAQRRKKDNISIKVIEESVLDGVYRVRVRASQPPFVPVETLALVLPEQPTRQQVVEWAKGVVAMAQAAGRESEDIGTGAMLDPMGRPINPADKGGNMKKAFTAAVRRVTMSLVGCGVDDRREGEDEGGDWDRGPVAPRVVVPPTRVKAQKPQEALPAPQQTQIEAEPVPVPASAPEPAQEPPTAIKSAPTQAPAPAPTPAPTVAPKPQQPAPPAAPTPAPKVTVVGKRAVYIPPRG